MRNKKNHNEVTGLPAYYKNSSLHMTGGNNKITFGKEVFCKDSRIKLYGNSCLILEDGVYLEGCTMMIKDSHVRIGHHNEMMKVGIYAYDKSTLDLGPNSAITGEWDLRDGATITAQKLWCTWPPLVAAKGGKITMGDCGLADTVIYNTDYHPIYNFDGQVINENRDVVIEDNVWVGRRTVILKGVTLGNGCILGFGSVVSKSIPPHCIAAGMPAKVVKENVVWAAHNDPAYQDYFPLTSETAPDFFRKTKPKNNYEDRKIPHTCKLLNYLRIKSSVAFSKGAKKKK